MMRGSRTNLTESLYSTKIRLLDDSEISYDFKKETKGQSMSDYVCGQLDLLEKDYFGLRYVDNNKQRHWLDLSKEISKQLKDCRHPYMCFFRIKFYPTDPTKLAEEFTRYQVYLQLKRDILHGRLLCPFNNITDLAAHIVQAEIGDYVEKEHGVQYINGLKLLPRQNKKLEDKIFEYHKTLAGYNPAESENRFLNLARSQDLYGVDPHPCKDSEDFALYLGLTPQGVQIIREARRVSGFSWSDINKVSYDNKMFYVQVLREKVKTNYVFRLNDTLSCKHLWKCTVEHMAFYSVEPLKSHGSKKSVLSPQNLFRRSKHKFYGKTEHQLRTERHSIKRNSPKALQRKSTLKVSMPNSRSRLSMPNFQMEQLDMSNAEIVTTQNGSNETESQNSEPSTPQSNHQVKDSSLAEFEVKEFPDLSESSRNSLETDGISTCSSLENVNITDSVESDIPTVQVDLVSEENTLPNAIESSIAIPKNDLIKDCTPICITNTGTKTNGIQYENMFKNPLKISVFVAIILIPISVILYFVFTSK